ncbi:MAG: lipoate--protein ligase family protein [Candidatus Omnitrophica bacterium]|nr:lipoate--protein ligase family protein [Candidatus Omnitrophota bacterium]
MKYVDLTLPSPEENLALDEALLDWCEQGEDEEIIRLWEAASPFVVLGYSNKIRREVNLDSCRRLKIPILRRITGGGAVVQGPGCLNYALILRTAGSGPFSSAPGANCFILKRLIEILRPVLGRYIALEGSTDLTLGGLKFSGNAQRRKKRFLLFHGTFLLHFDLALIEKVLRYPSNPPRYRNGRPHREFLTNLNLPTHALKEALKAGWKAAGPLSQTPNGKVDELVRNRYALKGWTWRT